MRLSLILPTYNEAENLPELLRRIHASAEPFEVIVVDDDSPDRTWEIGERLKGEYPHLKIIRRIGAKGLSSAVADGCDAAAGEVFVVMDADMQHDPSLVARLHEAIEGGAGIAVASRYREGGGVGEWKCNRRWLSELGTYLARGILNVRTTDPMSGFFAVRSDVWKEARPRMTPEGFKILFELLGAVPRGLRLDEVPLQFRQRLHGHSKLSLLVQLQFLRQALRIALRRIGITGSRAFTAAIIVLAVTFSIRALPLLPLYVDSSLRTAVSMQIRDVAAARGWHVSDLSITSVGEDGSLTLERRVHRRGTDPRECWFLPSTGELVPCAR